MSKSINARACVIVLAAMFACGGLLACQQVGMVETSRKRVETPEPLPGQPGLVEESITRAKSPAGAISPAGIGADGSVSSGASPAMDFVAIGQASILTWAGVAMCVVGVGIIVARAWLPLVPVSAGVAALALGVGLIAAPILLDRYAGLLAAAGGLVAVTWGGVAAYRARRYDVATSPEVVAELKREHPDAAGALYRARTGDITGAKAIAQGVI